MSDQAAEVLYFQFFAWSAIPWVPEVLSARHAFVTSLSQAGKVHRISHTNILSHWDFVRFGQIFTKYFAKYLCGYCTKYS